MEDWIVTSGKTLRLHNVDQVTMAAMAYKLQRFQTSSTSASVETYWLISKKDSKLQISDWADTSGKSSNSQEAASTLKYSF